MDGGGQQAPPPPQQQPPSAPPQFRHPGTMIDPNNAQALYAVFQGPLSPELVQARDALLQEVIPDLQQPPKAVPEVLVVFNPAPHDLAKYDEVCVAFHEIFHALECFLGQENN